MTCRICEELKRKIKSPADLTDALKQSKMLLDDKIIVFVGSTENYEYYEDVLKTNLWGDFVEFHFLCDNCGQELCLYAETYHGSGGAFEAIDKGQKIYEGYHT